MSEELLIAVLALIHGVLAALVGLRVYKCVVESQCVGRSEEEDNNNNI